MIPNPKWFPSSLQERAAWYENFNANIILIGGSLGLGAGDMAIISTDNDAMQFLASTMVTVDAYVDAIRSYKNVLTEGVPGEQNPDFPTDLAFTAPSGNTGMFQRLDNIVKRIRVSATFTEEAGSLLGINTNGGPLGPIDEFPPVIKASVDPGNIVEVKFTRGRSDGIYIEINVDNSDWTFKEKAIKSPAVFDVDANPANTPRGVQIRARFLDGNNPVGDWSDIVTVQTIP